MATVDTVTLTCWRCAADISTTVPPAGTRLSLACPGCGHAFFYPFSDHASSTSTIDPSASERENTVSASASPARNETPSVQYDPQPNPKEDNSTRGWQGDAHHEVDGHGCATAKQAFKNKIGLWIAALWKWISSCISSVRSSVSAWQMRRRARIAFQEEQSALEQKRIVLRHAARALRASEIARLRTASLSHADTLLALTPREFETAVCSLYRQLGYTVKQTPFSNDRGRDAIAFDSHGSKYVIECKRYAADRAVGRRDLQIFFAAMIEEDAKGIFVTTGRFASTAPEFAEGKELTLVDGKRLRGLFARAYCLDSDRGIYEVMCPDCGRTWRRRVRASNPPVCEECSGTFEEFTITAL